MTSYSSDGGNGVPMLHDLRLQGLLQQVYGSDDAGRPCLIDLRDAETFIASRLRDSYSVPLPFLVPRMFLLPGREIPLGLVVGGPPATQMVHGAAAAGGAKKDIQLTSFLESRGWRVAFCIEASTELWRVAEGMGVLERGGCALTLKRRWPFQPSKLLMQQADLVEEMLVTSRLSLVASQEPARESSGCSPATNQAGGERAAVQPAGAPRGTCSVTLRMLDIGCGSGRDLAWLATRGSVVRMPETHRKDDRGADVHCDGDAGPGRATDVQVTWECVGLDSWHGALQRAAEVLALGEVPAGPGGVTLHLVQIGPGGGELRPLSLPSAAAKTPQMQLLRRYLVGGQGQELPKEGGGGAPADAAAAEHEQGAARSAVAGSEDDDGEPREALDLSALGRFDLLVCVRFLERSFLRSMAELLQPGGVILFSTFVDGPGLRAFGRPQGREHVLQPDELSKTFFGPSQGFEVVVDGVEAIADGREVSMFCARKLAPV
ncbi:hypothetical protein PLESTB_000465800 [Pleodorina starrii]|uniref:Rhodanese domain-containing protein n=1 Tax=Pleodorina starrii TaxID=330485 RepID=A0A9W6BFF6_9CHLO|nr:hypothetical protein PLESTM_000800300 [Pleodorina starrii]GLC51099.1 hypothetical protein PLESTB_000465800 [Pleodorina starrii]GLC63457.1 hypothetical protein PLESTF_000038300 [Pleodorina starrii]